MKTIGLPSFPREHGAWGILLGAFFSVTAFTGSLTLSQFWLLLSFVTFYISRPSFLSIIRGRYTGNDVWWFVLLALLGWVFLFLSALFAHYPAIIPASLMLLPFLLLEILLIRKRKQTTFAAQLLGTLGLTTIAPLSLLLYQKDFSPLIGFAWLINILFFTSGILFVRYQIAALHKTSQLRQYKMGMIFFHLTLLLFLISLGLVNREFTGLFYVFIPVFFQATVFLFSRITLKSLRLVGWMQIGQTLVFVLLLSTFL